MDIQWPIVLRKRHGSRTLTPTGDVRRGGRSPHGSATCEAGIAAARVGRRRFGRRTKRSAAPSDHGSLDEYLALCSHHVGRYLVGVGRHGPVHAPPGGGDLGTMYPKRPFVPDDTPSLTERRTGSPANMCRPDMSGTPANRRMALHEEIRDLFPLPRTRHTTNHASPRRAIDSWCFRSVRGKPVQDRRGRATVTRERVHRVKSRPLCAKHGKAWMSRRTGSQEISFRPHDTRPPPR